MRKLTTNEEKSVSRIVTAFTIVILIAAAVWIYLMYESFNDLQTFTDTTLERYQSEQVEMALARDYVEGLLTSTSTEITHESRNGNMFYFQGDESDGAFMFVIEQVAPGQFELVNGVSSINIENAN